MVDPTMLHIFGKKLDGIPGGEELLSSDISLILLFLAIKRGEVTAALNPPPVDEQRLLDEIGG